MYHASKVRLFVLLCNDIPLDSKEVPITEGIEQRAGSGHFFSCPSRILTGCFLNRLGHSKPMTRGPNFEPGFGPIQPLQRQKNGVLSYMDLQKDEECHLFRSYFIFDVATKHVPLKAEMQFWRILYLRGSYIRERLKKERIR